MIKLLLLIFLCSCTQEPKKHINLFTGNAMTIEYRISIAGTLELNEINIIDRIIGSTFNEINQTYNRYNPKSEISIINNLKPNEKIKISDELYNFLLFTGRMVELTDGRFDPTVEPLLVLWKEHFKQNSIPSLEEIQEVEKKVGWNHIHIADGYFSKDTEAQLDLGGIAKGHAVDMLTERLIKAGYEDLLVEWGGEIRSNGKHPEGRPWTIFIARLKDTSSDNAVATLALHDEAIATSGDYNQNWEIDGVKYTHVIDPKTLKPIIITDTSIASVSVMAKNCTIADALATAALQFSSPQEAESWIEKIDKEYPSIEFWFVTHE